MRIINVAMLTVVLTVAGAGAAHAQEGVFRVHSLAGLQNQPGGFDMFRNTDYDPGKLIGAGLSLGLLENFSIRADFSFAAASGQESAPVNEGIQLNRSYYGVALELRVPIGRSAFAPYLFGGGGLVNLRRDAPSYAFDFTETAAQFGGGLSYSLPDSPFSVLLQVTEWVYNRTSAGGTQYDTALGLGVAYRLPL